MEQKKAADRAEELLELQDSLDQYTFGRETMDVEKIKQIVSRLDEVLEEEPQEFRKEEVWSRICAACAEAPEEAGNEKDAGSGKDGRLFDGELSEEFGAESFRLLKGKGEYARGKKSAGRMRAGGRSGRKRRFLFVGIAAAALMITLFIGVNVGTYATEKKNVFEIVDEARNGTMFRVNGDVQMLDYETGGNVYFAWKDVPNEYRSLILIPCGLPEELELYRIKISTVETFDLCQIRYLNESGNIRLDLEIVDYQSKEFAFQDLLFEEAEYTPLKEERINNIAVKYYKDSEKGHVVRFTDDVRWFTFYGNLPLEVFENIVYKTIDNNF